MVGMSFSRHSLLKNAHEGFITRNPELERGYTKIFNKVNKWLTSKMLNSLRFKFTPVSRFINYL